MMKISVAEFKADIDQYLELADKEDVIIIKDGKYFKMAPVPGGAAEYLLSLRGILPETATVEEAREERLAKYERHL